MANRTAWKKRIKTACVDAGTYKPYFDSVIDTLSSILEKRDEAEELMVGESLIVEHTNKGGNTNLEQHPAVRLINDLNRDALAYWRDLGLTPKGLKAIRDDALNEVKADALTEALKELS